MTKNYKILVSQPKPALEHNPYSDMEKAFGVHFDFRQFVRIEGLDVIEFRQQHIRPLEYTAVLLNSRLAVDHYFRICNDLRLQVPDSMHYYCSSEAIANYLQKYIQYRKRKVFYAEHNNFEELLPTMNRRPGEKFLMVVAETHTDDIINMLASHKIKVTPAVMYRTVPAPWNKEDKFDYQMVALFTPTGAVALHDSFPELKQDDIMLAAYGQSTIAALQQYGLTPQIQAPTPQFTSITAAIRNYLEEHLS